MLAAAAVPFSPSAGGAVLLVFLVNAGRAAWGAVFLAFNQDISPERVGMIAAIMGCIGALAAALLIWAIGIVSQAHGFRLTFLGIAALAVVGVIPVLLVHWDADGRSSLLTRETATADVP